MAYTAHGHHISGTPQNEERRSVARCGGPGLCKECNQEVVLVKIADVPTRTPQELIHESHNLGNMIDADTIECDACFKCACHDDLVAPCVASKMSEGVPTSEDVAVHFIEPPD